MLTTQTIRSDDAQTRARMHAGTLHFVRHYAEMVAAMLLPPLAAIALLAPGAVEDTGVLLVAEHIAMLAAMLVADVPAA